MAAIDFPASPTVGQIFAAGNSINYQWTGTLWLAVGTVVSPSPGADFCASSTVPGMSAGVTVVVSSLTVMAGNSPGYLNPTTGRFTPPAGRYLLQGYVQMYSSVSLIIGATGFRKNGVAIAGSVLNSTSPAANNFTEASSAVLVDANGTDYFEMTALGHVSASVTNALFMAFPISGIKGPPGDPGQLGWRLLNRQVLGSAAAFIEYTGIPSDINDIEFRYDLTPVTNDSDCVMQWYFNGALDNAGGHYASAVSVGSHVQAGGSAPSVAGSSTLGVTNSILFTYSVATRKVSATSGIRGKGTISNIKATRLHGTDYQSNYVSGDNTVLLAATGDGYNGTNALPITGLRLLFGSGNVAAGGTLSVWGSP